MIRKITLLFLLCFGILDVTYAQPICGFDGAHQQLMNQSSTYSQKVGQFNTQLAQWLSNNQNLNSLLTTNSAGDTIYEVPLVVHVMHTGGSIGSNYNISDAQIINTIDYVNQTFAATWSGYAPVGSGGTKFPFRFKLAQRTPNCATTNGIVRVNASATYSNYTSDGVNRSGSAGVNDIPLKALSIWPNDRYYNIWVVNKIDGIDGYPGSGGPFVAGYAYFPGAPADRDGTIMLASQMNTGKTTLPHELGHAFALYHTFEASNPSTSTCPPNTSCTTQGDLCCDTEPHYQYGAGTCYSGQTNLCTSATFGDATAKNIMNYANCTDRFTPDQRDRFIGAILGIRSTLISSSASLPLPTTSLPTPCTPGITNATNVFQSGPRNVKVTDASPGTRVYMDVKGDGYGDYNADGNVTYKDYTCQHQIALKAGNTYTLSFTSNFNDKGAAFIDYNNDGLLGNTSGERLAVVDQSGGSLHTVTFTVPYTATSCTPIRMRVISDRTTGYIDSCSDRLYGQTEDYEVFIYGTNSNTASINIANPPVGGNPSCFGTTLTFEATPSTGTTVVGYQWFINSSPIAGQTYDTFTSNIFVDKDTVKIEMYYANLCGVDTVRDSVVVERRTTIAPAVTIGVTGGTNPTCIDDTVTLSVVGNVNPGGSPTYQWRSNGTNITGATGPTFKAIGRGGETITCRMESSASSPCSDPGFAISNGIQIQYTTKVPIANIALTIGTNPGCAGQALQFTATPTTGGTAPTYQWTVNGTPVAGATNVNFNTSTLKHNDQVRVIMTSNSPCASPTTVTSAPIAVIHEKITADITIAQTTGTNPACEGKPLIFSANTTNAGKNPTFQWIVDGIPMVGATSPIYVTDSLRNNNRVQCILIATDSCVANPRDTSNFITMVITTSKRPKVTVEITAGKNPGCLDSLVEFTATAIDLGTAPDYRWIINGFAGPTGNVFVTNSLLDANTVMVRANQTDNGCYLPDTVYSQPMVMVRSVTPKEPVISLLGNMIHTNFDSSFVWFGPRGQDTVNFKNTNYPDTIGKYWAVTNNNGCWSKPSNILGITLLDLNTVDLKGLEVYPNPTSDKVVLDWHGTLVSYSIDVYNSIGQVVLHEEVKETARKEISLGKFAAGNYVIVLKDQEGKVGTIKVAVGNN